MDRKMMVITNRQVNQVSTFSSYIYVVKAAEKTFVQKICTFNIDEIDYSGQFHQYTYAQLLHKKIPKDPKDSQVISVFFVLLGSSRTKAAYKTLMELTLAWSLNET